MVYTFQLTNTQNKIIFTIGTCEDDTKIKITLSGDALSAAGHVQGIYAKFATSNGKPAWNHASYDHSIWWGSNGFWMIGPKAEIGSSTGWLYNPKSRQPYDNGNDWLYHNGTEWVNPIGEIKVECNQSVRQQVICMFVSEEVTNTLSRQAPDKEARPSPYHCYS